MQPQTLSDHIHLLQTIVTAAVAVGAAVASFWFNYQLKQQSTNGDGRTLRKAVDDLADSFHDHRTDVIDRLSDVRDRIDSVHDRVVTLEDRVSAVEKG